PADNSPSSLPIRADGRDVVDGHTGFGVGDEPDIGRAAHAGRLDALLIVGFRLSGAQTTPGTGPSDFIQVTAVIADFQGCSANREDIWRRCGPLDSSRITTRGNKRDPRCPEDGILRAFTGKLIASQAH